MKIEDRLRRLGDDSRWAPHAPQPRAASRVVQERHGLLVLRLSLGLGAIGVLCLALIGGTIYGVTHHPQEPTTVGAPASPEPATAPPIDQPTGPGLILPATPPDGRYLNCPEMPPARMDSPDVPIPGPPGLDASSDGAASGGTVVSPAQPATPNGGTPPSPAQPPQPSGSGSATSSPVTPALPQFPQATQKLVPFTPSNGLACVYGDADSSRAGQLVEVAVLDDVKMQHVAFTRLLAQLNQATPENGEKMACTKSSGGLIDFFFDDSDGAQIPVSVPTSGCIYAVNGTAGFSVTNLDAVQHTLAPFLRPIPATPLTSCPANAPPLVTHNEFAQAGALMVPFAPLRVQACAYRYSNEPGGQLAASAVTSRPESSTTPAELATALNSAIRSRAGDGVAHAPQSCPPPVGFLDLVFSRNEHSITVRIALGSCDAADNGLAAGEGALSTAVAQELKTLFGPDVFLNLSVG